MSGLSLRVIGVTGVTYMLAWAFQGFGFAVTVKSAWPEETVASPFKAQAGFSTPRQDAH